jgi:hypothetical protein
VKLPNLFSTLNTGRVPTLFTEFDDGMWCLIESLPIFCNICGSPEQVFINVESNDWSAGTLLFCATCKKARRFIETSSQEKRFMADFWKLAEGRFLELNRVTKPLTSSNNDFSSTAKSSVSRYLDNRLKIVCWLKKGEAKAIIAAYEKQRSQVLKNTAGAVLATAEWNPTGSDNQLRFKTNANVRLVRHKSTSDRSIGWIYQLEAEKTLIAMETRESIEEFSIENNSELVGAFAYFSDESEEFKIYRSNVCLLRKRGHKYGV